MKKLLLLVFILSISVGNAQTEIIPEPHKNWYEPEDPETVFFGLSFYFPNGIGDSSLGNDYSFDAGIQFEVNVFITPQFVAGVYGKWHEGEVTNIEKIGNISDSNFSEYGLSLGYYQAINRQFNYMITAGIGAVTLNNTVPFSPDSFRENGTSYKVTGELGYRFNQTIAIFAKVSPYYLNLDIENAAYDSYLNKHFLVDVGFGLRVHLHNPNG
ncbi:hypothetical protein SAMN04487907_101561 [Zunongwangia mangrovi]|uniref:Outer membrane protein beta-barrel domain-containing protein n=1 Tax=Zunongwangia mangrovi TaxID=1334022 RepID=A0A1I1DQW7_9FLAO|nr:hypothetical protein [Zunongwangia mangrovi]SFB77197.1 hypothetical protein SAMN04487907_101561 [Zunongwangia mangrovi]